MTTVNVKKIISLCLVLFLTISSVSLPVVNAQEEEPEEDMLGDMMGMMMGMFMSLDVTVSAPTNKLQSENATIYITTSTSGAPLSVDNLTIWMMYDSGDEWEEGGGPFPWGFGEIQNGEDIDRGLGKIWHGGAEDPDTQEWMEIPGLYAITWTQGWLPGDYLITAFAQTNMTALMGMAMGDQLGGIMDLFGDSAIMGSGSFCITVSETLTMAAFTTFGIAEGLGALGESMTGFQSAFENMTLYLENMTVFQKDMELAMSEFQTSFENMTVFQNEMTIFQDDMAIIFENMSTFQETLGSTMEAFVDVLESSRLEIEALRGKIATVGTDVGEMIVALPLLYEEAQQIGQVTAAGVPIAYMLSAIAAIAAIIAVIFLVTLRRELRYRIRVSAR
jgi:hypothetical protein